MRLLSHIYPLKMLHCVFHVSRLIKWTMGVDTSADPKHYKRCALRSDPAPVGTMQPRSEANSNKAHDAASLCHWTTHNIHLNNKKAIMATQTRQELLDAPVRTNHWRCGSGTRRPSRCSRRRRAQCSPIILTGSDQSSATGDQGLCLQSCARRCGRGRPDASCRCYPASHGTLFCPVVGTLRRPCTASRTPRSPLTSTPASWG